MKCFSAKKYLVDVPTLVLGVDVTHPTALEERSGVPSVAAVSRFRSDEFASLLFRLFSGRGQFGSVADEVRIEREGAEEDARVGRLSSGRGARTSRPFLQSDQSEADADHRLSRRRLRRTVPRGHSEFVQIYSHSYLLFIFQVLREEMQGIRTACLMLSSEYRPPITFVVVQKRHHARFFCQNIRDASGRARNIPPGTAVDTGIVSPEGFDFYLCSHFGIQVPTGPFQFCCAFFRSASFRGLRDRLAITCCGTTRSSLRTNCKCSLTSCATCTSVVRALSVSRHRFTTRIWSPHALDATSRSDCKLFWHYNIVASNCRSDCFSGLADSDTASEMGGIRSRRNRPGMGDETETETESESGVEVSARGSSSSDSALQESVQVSLHLAEIESQLNLETLLMFLCCFRWSRSSRSACTLFRELCCIVLFLLIRMLVSLAVLVQMRLLLCRF